MSKASVKGQNALEEKCSGLTESFKAMISELSRGSQMKQKYLKAISDVEEFSKTCRTDKDVEHGKLESNAESPENVAEQNEQYLLKANQTSSTPYNGIKSSYENSKFPFKVCIVAILEGVEHCKSKGKTLLPLISAIQHLLCISDLLLEGDVEDKGVHLMLGDLFKAFEIISSSSVESVLLRLVQTILQLCSQNSQILHFGDLIIHAFHIFDSLLPQSKVETVVKCGLRQLVSCIAAQNVIGCIMAPNKLRNEDVILKLVKILCETVNNLDMMIALPKVTKSGYGLFKRDKDSQQGKILRSNTHDSAKMEALQNSAKTDDKGAGRVLENSKDLVLHNFDGKFAFDMLLILIDSLPSGTLVTACSLQSALNTDILPCINRLFSNGNPQDASTLLIKVLVGHIYYAESHKSCEIGVQISLEPFEEFIYKGIESLTNDKEAVSDKQTSKAWMNCFKQLLGSPEFVYASMCSNLIHKEILEAITKFQDREAESIQYRVNLSIAPETNNSMPVEPWHKKYTCQISHLLRPLPLFSIEVNADSCALDINNMHKDFSIENVYLQCVYNYISTLYTVTLNCLRDTVYYVPYKILYMDGSGIKCSTNMDFRSDVETIIGIIKGFKKYDRAVFTCLQSLLVVCKLKGLDRAYEECINLIIGKSLENIKSGVGYDPNFPLNSTMCMCSIVVNFSGILTQEAWFLILEKLFRILYENDPESGELVMYGKSTDSPKNSLVDKRQMSDSKSSQKLNDKGKVENMKMGGSVQYFTRKFVPIIWSIFKSKVEAFDSETLSKFLIASGLLTIHRIHENIITGNFSDEQPNGDVDARDEHGDYETFMEPVSHFVQDWEDLYIQISGGSTRYNGTHFERYLNYIFSQPLPFWCSPREKLRYHKFLIKAYIACTENVPFTSYKMVTMLNSMILYSCFASHEAMPGLEVVTSYIAKKTCSLMTQVCISDKHSEDSIEALVFLLYQLSIECKFGSLNRQENFVGITLEQILSGLYSLVLSVFNILERSDRMLEILHTLTEICAVNSGDEEQSKETSGYCGNIDVLIDIFASLVENSLDYLNEKACEKFAKCLHMLASAIFSDNVIFRIIGLMVNFADHIMKLIPDGVDSDEIVNGTNRALLCTTLAIFRVACLSSNVSKKNCAIKSLALFIQTHLHSFDKGLWDYTCKDVLYCISEELRDRVDLEVRKYAASEAGSAPADVSVHNTVSALSETQSLLLACKEFSGAMVGSSRLYCAVDVLNSLLRGIGSSVNAILNIKSSIVDLKQPFSTLSTILIEYRGLQSVWNTGLHLLDRLQSEETKHGIYLVLCAVLTDPNAEMGQTEEIVRVCLGKDLVLPSPRSTDEELLPFVVPPWFYEHNDYDCRVLELPEYVYQGSQVKIVSSMASVLKIELRDKIANSVGILQDMQLLQLVSMNYVPNILTHQGVYIQSTDGNVDIKGTLSDSSTMENITAYLKEPPLFKVALGNTQFTPIFSCMKSIKEASSLVSLVNCLVCKLLRREIEDLAMSLQFLDYIANTFHELVLKFVQECVDGGKDGCKCSNMNNSTPRGNQGAVEIKVSPRGLDLEDEGEQVISARSESFGMYTCVTIDITKKSSYTVNVEYIDDIISNIMSLQDDAADTTTSTMFRNGILVSAPIILDALVKFTECNPHTEIYIISYQCALDIAKCAYVGAFFDMHINGFANRESLMNYWCALRDSLLFYRKSAPLESSGINFTTLLHSIAIEFVTSLVISPFSIAPHFASLTFVDILDSYVTSKSPILCRIALQRLSDAATCPQVYDGTECKRVDEEDIENYYTLYYRLSYVKSAFFLLFKHLKSFMKGTDVEKLAAMQIAETIVTPPTKALFNKQEMEQHKLLECNQKPMLYLLHDDILDGLNGSERVSQASKKLLNLLLKSLGVAKFDK
ncbi:hypothetical protein BEWA_039990 [Theileria equi strain WA]|uniref:Uncharacterized protein n=1 Tax=Theileria equi strain WA TaxID=1537102 RepID=L1LF29_THEEQ|nr:hypothetical protein BEWA_039990 [Theileria equi strain WA]EKX73961.1 hypothetical protein BEWA_039990 [Theileria equi strain WA]|eukprot:XP_004833413.1 hypothetical protein BEWA_039990 [Theileria equi strain WA]